MSELRGLQLRNDEFEKLGIQVVGIVVDPPETNRAVVHKMGLDFPILADPELKAIGAFGLVHENGSPTGGTIARPALYLLQGGQVRWRSLTDNWRVRPRADEILQAARESLQAS